MQYKNDFECEGYKLASISVNGYYVNLLPMFRVTSAIAETTRLTRFYDTR